MALCLRLIVETGNGGELHAGTISAISIVLQSGMVEIGARLFDRLDGIDLGRLRRACRGRNKNCSHRHAKIERGTNARD
jgi:hypothetical protein